MNLSPEMMPLTHCHQCPVNSGQLAASTPRILGMLMVKQTKEFDHEGNGEFETGVVTGTHAEMSVAMDFHITMYRGVASASAEKNCT
jgi:hypothetical protein